MKNPPDYKPFRTALWALYISVALFIAVCLLTSGYLGARERMGAQPEPAGREAVDAAALAVCMGELRVLYAELNSQLGQTLGNLPARRSSVEWEDWSPGWRTRLLAVGARCRLEEGDVPGSEPLKDAYERVHLLHRHYTTLAVQFSKEIGPHCDNALQAMEKAGKSVGAAAAPN